MGEAVESRLSSGGLEASGQVPSKRGRGRQEKQAGCDAGTPAGRSDRAKHGNDGQREAKKAGGWQGHDHGDQTSLGTLEAINATSKRARVEAYKPSVWLPFDSSLPCHFVPKGPCPSLW